MREETCVCSPGQIWKPEAAAPWLHDSSCKVTFHTVYVADVTCLQLFVVIGHKHIKMFFFPHLWTWTSKSKWMWQIFSEVFCINVNKRKKHAAVIYSTCWDKKFCVYTCRFVCSFQVCIYGYALSCKMVCVCVWKSAREEPIQSAASFSGCICVCQSVRVSGVYKALAVGVCSCVYPSCPEIVTELRKQFTVNKSFPCSNKGPMRLNSVLVGQPPLVSTNSIHRVLCRTPLFCHFGSIRPGPDNDRTLSPISLGPWMGRKMFLWEKRSYMLPLECLVPRAKVDKWTQWWV